MNSNGAVHVTTTSPSAGNRPKLQAQTLAQFNNPVQHRSTQHLRMLSSTPSKTTPVLQSGTDQTPAVPQQYEESPKLHAGVEPSSGPEDSQGQLHQPGDDFFMFSNPTFSLTNTPRRGGESPGPLEQLHQEEKEGELQQQAKQQLLEEQQLQQMQEAEEQQLQQQRKEEQQLQEAEERQLEHRQQHEKQLQPIQEEEVQQSEDQQYKQGMHDHQHQHQHHYQLQDQQPSGALWEQHHSAYSPVPNFEQRPAVFKSSFSVIPLPILESFLQQKEQQQSQGWRRVVTTEGPAFEGAFSGAGSAAFPSAPSDSVPLLTVKAQEPPQQCSRSTAVQQDQQPLVAPLAASFEPMQQSTSSNSNPQPASNVSPVSFSNQADQRPHRAHKGSGAPANSPPQRPALIAPCPFALLPVLGPQNSDWQQRLSQQQPPSHPPVSHPLEGLAFFMSPLPHSIKDGTKPCFTQTNSTPTSCKTGERLMRRDASCWEWTPARTSSATPQPSHSTGSFYTPMALTPKAPSASENEQLTPQQQQQGGLIGERSGGCGIAKCNLATPNCQQQPRSPLVVSALNEQAEHKQRIKQLLQQVGELEVAVARNQQQLQLLREQGLISSAEKQAKQLEQTKEELATLEDELEQLCRRLDL